MTRRPEVYEALDSERAYQDSRWNEKTTLSGGRHSLEEWLVYLQDYLTEAVHLASRLPQQEAQPKVLANVRKIGAMCVAAMEQHGAPKREGF